MDETASQFDMAWKQALLWFFQSFLAFFFPRVHEAINWSKEPEFLDKELQKIAPEAEVGRGTVDMLARVVLLDGTEAFLLIHVEVQSQYDASFAARMYTYNHRLTDRYGLMPVSLAILGDTGDSWRPSSYRQGKLGCEVSFTFLAHKLLDYRTKEKALATEPNPFAAVTLAHLSALETRGNASRRYAHKLELVKTLYDRGLTRERVLQLFRLIDWILNLPPVMSRQFTREIEMFEKERDTPLLSPTEQIWREDAITEGREIGLKAGLEEGRQEGRQEGLKEALVEGVEVALAIRFGEAGAALLPRVRELTDVSLLARLLRAIQTVTDLDQLRDLLAAQS